jgi:predicted unusual protein kinase regulating ubiquinone biosynthesis (AarF/ABC1/UbiB family)
MLSKAQSMGRYVHTYLWQLLGYVTTHKYCFKIHPQVLHYHPVLYYVSGVGQLLDPQLNILFKGSIVPRVIIY